MKTKKRLGIYLSLALGTVIAVGTIGTVAVSCSSNNSEPAPAPQTPAPENITYKPSERKVYFR